MATNFEPHEWVIFIQSTTIGTHKNNAIHSAQQFISDWSQSAFVHFIYIFQ